MLLRGKMAKENYVDEREVSLKVMLEIFICIDEFEITSFRFCICFIEVIR